MLKSRLLASAGGCALVGSILTGALASGQAAAATADEIVVQARKRAEYLQDIPVSGSVVGEQEIRDFGGIQSDIQLGEYLTGVTVDEEGNPEYFIRGAGTGRSPQTSSATTQLFSGADAAGGFGGRSFEAPDSFDIRQIEVYRGAQGSLYGRNAVGGVLNFIPYEPNAKFSYYTQGTWNVTDEGYRGEAVVNVPVNETTYLRFGGYAEKEDGPFYNDYKDEPFANVNTWGARVSAKKLFDGWDALVMVHYGEYGYNSLGNERNAFKPGVFGVVPNVTSNMFGLVTVTPGTVLPRDVHGNVLPAGTMYDYPVSSNGDYFHQAFDSNDFYFEHTLNALLKVNVDLPFATLSSITNIRDRVYEYMIDTDGSYIGGIYGGMGSPTVATAAFNNAGQCTEPLFASAPIGMIVMGQYVGSTGVVTRMCENESNTETFLATQEFRLVSPDTGRLSWLAGVDVRLLRNPIFDTARGRNDIAALETAMGATMLSAQAVSENQTTDSDTVNLATGIYGSIGYDITDKFNVAFSARATYERASIDLVGTDTDTGEVLKTFDDAAHFRNFSPSVTLTYDFGDQLVYASWAQAHRAGGFNRFSGTAVGQAAALTVDRKFDEELANSYEIGFKDEIRWSDGMLRIAADAFRVEYNGALLSILVQSNEDSLDVGDTNQISFDSGVVNIGDAYVQGIESDLTGLLESPFNLGGRLIWTGGIAFAESNITMSLFARPALEGGELTFVNTWSYNGNFTYRRPLPFLENTGLGFFFNTNFKYEIDTDNLQNGNSTDTRKAWNARVGIEGENYGQSWQFQLFMNNIWDVTYQRSRPAGVTALVSNGAIRSYETPTNWGLRLTVRGGE